jgi:K+-transporting ATPase A subunit
MISAWYCLSMLIMGGLPYFPAVSLGPVTEQVAMSRGIHHPAP